MGLLHIRTFNTVGTRTDTYETMEGSALHLVSTDASGKVLSDTLESSLPAAQSSAIAALKQQLRGLMLPQVPTDAKRSEVLSEVTSIIDHVLNVPEASK